MAPYGLDTNGIIRGPIHRKEPPGIGSPVEYAEIRPISMYLKVETGRWSRTPRERRLCSCNMNATQNENQFLAVHLVNLLENGTK